VLIHISKKITCIGQDVVIDDDGVTFDSDPVVSKEYWHFGDAAYRSITRIAQALEMPMPQILSDPKIAWWTKYTQTPRIDLILGRRHAMQYVKSIVETSQKVIDASSYFKIAFQRQNKLLDLIQHAYADKTEVDQLSLAESIPIDDPKTGRCKIPVYDNFSSSTGRMSIKTGPRVLNLSKQHRHVFRSRWGKEGVILGVDFTALEPRVIMRLLGEEITSTDIYSQIANKARLNNLDRDTIKLMILSILYGMSRKNFIVKFIMMQDPDVVYDALREAIGAKALLDKIKSETKDGVFKNHYGRPLKCDQNLMINYFTQSSAVDVACDGFLNLLEENESYVVPIFLIHDELVIDVMIKDQAQIEAYCKNGIYIPSLETNFPVKIKVFNGREDH